MKTLYYQCPSGISGDMNLGAMVDLGVDPARLEAALRKLPYTGWSLRFETDTRGGISGTRCDVVLDKAAADDHSHPHGGHHAHRGFAEIRDAIEKSELPERVKRDAVACFRVLAEAEGAVHGVDPDAVHFHEVGAIDSIVDTVGAAVCWDLLGIERVVCSVLETGGGTVDCAHGRMPVPAPATVRLLEGVPYRAGGVPYEATTPTGAALLVGKGCEFLAATQGRQIGSGIGIGQRNPPDAANVLYVSLIEESGGRPVGGDGLERDEVRELAANIDDMTGEAVGFLCSCLREAGALDVWQVPAYFKHDRPGCVVHVLAAPETADRIEALLFEHSSTLGVRRQTWRRAKLKREIVELETEWGSVRVKVASGPNGLRRHKFEYRDCARIAAETGRPLAGIQARLEAIYLHKNG